MPADETAIVFDALEIPADVRERCAAEAARRGGEPVLGRVVQLDRTLPLVCTGQGSRRAEHAVALVKETDTLSAVGDWVVVDFPPGHDNAVVLSILPRKNALSRPDPKRKGGRQTLAANIDVVFIVTPFSERGIDLGNLERQLVLAYQSDADPVIVLSKADLAGSPEEAAGQLESVRRIAFDVPVVAESAETGLGVSEVAGLIPKGRTGALLGRSGVGKSTLLNALVGRELQRTGAVRASDGKGRHTTIARKMVLLPQGGLLIDSPGLRSFSLTGSFEGVARAFPDIGEMAMQCRFRDCSHVHEPGCGVRAALAEGALEERRYRSYLTIMEEVAQKAERW